MTIRNRTKNVAIPGRGAGRSIPSGYLIGRTSKGQGRLELMGINELTSIGMASNHAVANATSNLPGFNFNIGGRPAAGEEVGSGTWGHNVIFDPAQVTYTITASIPSTGTAVFDIKVFSGVYTAIGTITFTSSATGVLAWVGEPVIPAGVQISLWAPASQDATLAGITGIVYGASI
ncbi:hypothetical protein UFOVP134_2 [uncultured Caudovirales phage]|uniref:Uncharacterized protein n=1 Tax=uncultured Caudovirales phage TaxID=2100421 RepID=A0A6J5LCM8_9CAUD|nr:hypothetical protein UFOVP134_2 [uncultured Caudovirales phage]